MTPRLTRKVLSGLFLLIDMGRADFEVAPENWEPEQQREAEAAIRWFTEGGFEALSRRHESKAVTR